MDSGAAPRGRRIDDIARSPVDGLDPIEVEKWRWFGSTIVWERYLESLPTIFVPIFVILFFAIVFGGSLFYEGKAELAVTIFIIAAVALALILGIWKKMKGV